MTKEKSALVQEKLDAQALLQELRSSKKELETQVGDKTSDGTDLPFWRRSTYVSFTQLVPSPLFLSLKKWGMKIPSSRKIWVHPKRCCAQKQPGRRVCVRKCKFSFKFLVALFCECDLSRLAVCCDFFFKMYFIYCELPPLTGCSSEALKEADSAKAHTLQQLKEENKMLSQELDSSHKGQSELSKVKSTPLVSHIS